MVAELVSIAPDASGQQLGYIPVDKVHNDRPQVRRDWRHHDGQLSFDDLVGSIEHHGVVQPIVVEQRDDGDYGIICGHGRYVAAKRAGHRHIPAVVRQAHGVQRTVLQLVENGHRRALSLADESAALTDLYQNARLSIAEIARSVGRTEEYVLRRVIIESDPVIGAAVKQGGLPLSDVGTLAELGRHFCAANGDGRPIVAHELAVLRDVLQREPKAYVRYGWVNKLNDLKDHYRHHGAPHDPEAYYRWIERDPARLAVYQKYTDPAFWRETYVVGEAFWTYHHAHKPDTYHYGQRHGPARLCVLCALRHSAAAGADEASPGPPAADEREAPRVTFNGVNLDPVISTAQERDVMKHADEDKPATAHARPTASSLPWENQDQPRLRYSVDPAGIVTPEPKKEASTAAAGPATPGTPRAPSTPAVAPSPPARPTVPPDPDVARLRLMLQGTQQPCHDLLRAVVYLGRERGWSCHELWRRVQAASEQR